VTSRVTEAELEAWLERERLERERRRLEEQARIRAEQEKQARIREKLRQISPCPAGFSWYKTGGGWRCGGGSHFVSDSQLNAHSHSLIVALSRRHTFTRWHVWHPHAGNGRP